MFLRMYVYTSTIVYIRWNKIEIKYKLKKICDDDDDVEMVVEENVLYFAILC